MSTEATPNRRRRRWPLGLAVVAVLLAALYFYRQSWRAQRVEQELKRFIAELDASEPGWRWDDLQASLPTYKDDENSAQILMSLGGYMPGYGLRTAPIWRMSPRRSTDLVALAALYEKSPEQRLTDIQAAALRAELAVHAPTVQAARRYADRPRGRYPTQWKPDYFSTPFDAYEVARLLRLLELQALLDIENASDADVERDLLAIFHAARSLGEEWSFMQFAVRDQGRRLWARLLERRLGQGEMSEATLAAWQARLAEEEADAVFSRLLLGMRAGYRNFFATVENKTLGTTFEAYVATYLCPPQDRARIRTGISALDRWIGKQRPPVAIPMEEELAILHFLTAAIAANKLPIEERDGQIAKLVEAAKDKPLLTGDPQSGVAIRVKHYHTQDLANRARLRLMIAALACERYRLRHGDWPTKLEQLVPDFLATAPRNPRDGKTFTLTRTVYGIEISGPGPVSGQAPLRVLLWQPQQRRQPAEVR